MKRIKNLLTLLTSYIPTPLPTGMTSFKKWSEDVILLTGPIADEDSLRFAMSNMIIHMKPDTGRVKKQYFVRCLRKAAANQVASQVFQDIKIKQQEAAEAAKKLAEATAYNKAVTDEPKKD